MVGLKRNLIDRWREFELSNNNRTANCAPESKESPQGQQLFDDLGDWVGDGIVPEQFDSGA